jgi:hypothetical protein
MTPDPTPGRSAIGEFGPLNQGGPETGGYGHLALALVLRAVGVSLGSAGLLVAALWTLLG